MARKLQPCGTVAAARRHQRNPDKYGPMCDECAQAIRDEKNGRVDERRHEDVAAARAAQPGPGAVDRDDVLLEVLRTLRGQLAEAPPQSVASIAKQIRDTLDALGVKSEPAQQMGGGVDDIAARRAEREARRRAASQG